MARQKKAEVSMKDRKIPVVNFTTGNLFYRGKRTGREIDLMGFGATDYVDFDELVTMKSSSPKFLTEPWMVVMDEEVVNYLGLNELYSKIVMPSEVGRLFDMKPSEFIAFLTDAPSGMSHVIITCARNLIAEEKLNDRRIISAIESKFKVELE